MISAIHPDSLEGYFETTNWCLKFLMFGWRHLYLEVTTKISGMFSTLFLYGFPLFEPLLNFCLKFLWFLAKFSTFWATSEAFCKLRSIFDRSWSEDGLGAVVAGGYECRWSFLADQHASPCFMTYRWGAGYSTGALVTALAALWEHYFLGSEHWALSTGNTTSRARFPVLYDL